jgi:WhiB family redox-sensing transcriptional regulator
MTTDQQHQTLTTTEEPAMKNEWQTHAACLGIDPDLFFPEQGEAGSTATHAKQVCAGCEVRTECLDYAAANAEQYGIWGGLSPRERQGLRTGRQHLRRPINHGTQGGYQAHRRRGEQACTSCIDANIRARQKRVAS